MKSAFSGLTITCFLFVSSVSTRSVGQDRVPAGGPGRGSQSTSSTSRDVLKDAPDVEQHRRELGSSLAAAISLVEMVSFGTTATSEKAGRSARLGLMADERNQCFCRLWVRLANGGAFSASIQSPAQISVANDFV